MTSDDLHPWFAAILAAPEDDAPRLALAAFLSARDDPRGEHIRLSCELERLDPRDPARAALEARCAELPAFHFFTPTPHSFPLSYTRRRGFIEELSCSPANFIAHAEALMRSAPIRVYDVFNPVPGMGPRLARCPALARLRGLKLTGTHPDDRAAILASPHLAGLHELSLSAQLDGRAAVVDLAAELRPLAALRVLHVQGTITADACESLADLAQSHNLDPLDLRGALIPASGLAQLRARLGEARVLPRPEPRVKFRFGVLDLAGAQLDADELQQLIADREYRDATRLVLTHNRIGDPGLAHLARSGGFPALIELDLTDTRITDTGARVLAREAVQLDRLEHLTLGEVPAEADDIGARDGSGVGDAVIHELARSPLLPALRSITRSKEYRRSSAGREGREVIPIERADGRLVESIVLHTIWP